jgi:hypothetical protein
LAYTINFDDFSQLTEYPSFPSHPTFNAPATNMAPKGGKSGGGGATYSTTSCPNAFQGHSKNQLIAYFVGHCIFFLVPLFTLVAMGRIRKRHPRARRLLGPVYIISLVFTLL